MATNCTI